jgi:hypothetical protein
MTEGIVRKNLFIIAFIHLFLMVMGTDLKSVPIFSLGNSAAVLAHGTGKHVMGTASAVETDRLEVKTKEGKDVTVRLTPDTQYRRSGAGSSARPQIGDRVAAEVTEAGDVLTAVEVRFATPQAKK